MVDQPTTETALIISQQLLQHISGVPTPLGIATAYQFVPVPSTQTSLAAAGDEVAELSCPITDPYELTLIYLGC